MIKIYKSVFSMVLLVTAAVSNAQDLVHYWNFNDNTSIATITTPTLGLVSGASITAIPGGTSLIDPAGGTGQNFNLLNLNAQNGDVFGTHLRFNEPIGGALEFALPTTGYENVIVKFATRRSGSGADDQLWSYSTDGTTYTPLITIHPANGDPTLQTLDLTAIPDADDNADFKLKVEFAQGAGGNVGNNRFDNFTLNATALGGDTNAPIVTIVPADGATNIAVSANMTIAFNEDVRLSNNDAIDDTNVDAVVEVRLDNALGALVPFDATFAGNVITINPISDLANNQEYYVALLPDQTEDLSGNTVVDVQSAVFTTTATQESFTAGDFAFVAYRMSATGADDEIAFVTFVDIPNGTNLNITDSKYTTNAQPQCAGGLVWTANANTCIPAGSVITVRTNTMTSNLGTLTGSGFGLSSNGDQVIIYTGTAAAPNYITAMSSNAWLTASTDCGGSLSVLPAGLADEITALNMSNAPGNVSGNTANAFYSGPQVGVPDFIRNAILNPFNWSTSDANTAPQTWPTWNFPKAIQVTNVTVGPNQLLVIFDGPVDETSGSNVSNYMGIDNLATATVNGPEVTLTYSPSWPSAIHTLIIDSVSGFVAPVMACPYLFSFDGTLSIQDFNAEGNAFVLYPNPSDKGIVYFNRTASVTVFDTTGKILLSANEVKSIDTSVLSSGLYVVKTSEGSSSKLIVK